MKYLLSAKISNKYRIYPDFIMEEDDDSIKDYKKRYFRNAIMNYGLNFEYKLCFLHTKKEKKENLNLRRNNNRHLKKKEGEYELYIIPTLTNVIKLL